ncbi:MAG: hypothetical protein JO261_14015, partial [Alphaproteobacteria bacterium]|nr:hypothetical protein [Alphaproteobacteria bacterium]
MRMPFLGFTFAIAAQAASAMSLSSADFADNATIPQVHYYPRCGGENLSPQLSWKGVPGSAKSLMLTMIDLDVPPNLW